MNCLKLKRYLRPTGVSLSAWRFVGVFFFFSQRLSGFLSSPHPDVLMLEMLWMWRAFDIFKVDVLVWNQIDLVLLWCLQIKGSVVSKIMETLIRCERSSWFSAFILFFNQRLVFVYLSSTPNIYSWIDFFFKIYTTEFSLFQGCASWRRLVVFRLVSDTLDQYWPF